jgi:NAD(P)H-quinone oxidoreductase subunit 5
MEAPTPVSALLHAGVVNIGGFVMIRLAPFMAHAPLAQALLVIIGMTTAVVAALVMTTRVTIKVTLAWSTCAQMGFMLVECGLGLWHLALLHLVAHSLYKAHAFLSSGTAVDVWRVRAIVGPRAPAPLWRILGASLLVLASVAGSVGGGWVLLGRAEPGPTLVPLTVVLGLSLSPLVVRAIHGGLRSLLDVVVRSFGVGALYFGGHAAAAHLLRFPEPATMPLTWLVVLLGFLLLFVVQMVLECRPDGPLAHALQPRLFVGLYLDELFTRMTFRLWPPRLERPETVKRALRVAETLEAR